MFAGATEKPIHGIRAPFPRREDVLTAGHGISVLAATLGAATKFFATDVVRSGHPGHYRGSSGKGQ